MKINDKKEISKRRFCPPHCLPHKLPFTKPVTSEHCHTHSNKLRMFHHKLFCRLIKCPNYKFMIKEYNKSKK